MLHVTAGRGDRVGGLRRTARVARWLLSAALASSAASTFVACSDDSPKSQPPAMTGGAGAGEGGAGGANDAPQTGGAGASSEAVGKLDDLVEAMGGPAPKAPWTMFVYGHADHSLSNSLIEDMIEMAGADLQGKVNVVVLADFDSSQTAMRLGDEHFPEGSELYLIPGGGEEPRLLATDVERDLDDPAQLERAAAVVFEAFPAEHHALIMWNHGGAWEGGFGHDSQNGTRQDSPGMPAETIAPAIVAGMKKAGIDQAAPLDLFSFDTCLMAGAEVAYPLRNLAPVYIANAEIDYGAGWDYTTTLTYLAAHATAEPTEIAATEVTHWDAHHTTKSSTNSDAVLRSHIGLDASKLGALADAAAGLSDAILKSETFTAADLARIAHNAAPAYGADFETGSSMPGLHDLGQLLDGLAATAGVPADIVDAATQARSALSATTLGVSLGAMRADAKQSGFHVELGLGTQLDATRLASYGTRASEWSAATGWDGLLKLLHDSADEEAPVIEHSVANADAAGPGVLPLVTFSTASADVQSGKVFLAKPGEDGALVIRGIIGQGSVAPNDEVQFEWDGHAVAVEGQPAMLLNWSDDGNPDDESALLKVPGFLKGADGETTEASLLFSNSDDVASYVIVSQAEAAPVSLSLTELRAMDETFTFTPFLISQNSAGETTPLPGEPIAIPESGTLAITTQGVEPGQYLLVTRLFDVWGNAASVKDLVTVSEAFEP
jgi:hypothetical protein